MGSGWSDWLQRGDSFGLDRIENTGALLAVAVVGSLLSSLVLAAFYRWFYAARGTGSEIHRAFPLIGPAVTAIFIAVQFSLPLSLGLLGALSFVRFRTPIKEGEEIGFILVVVATSLSWAVLNLQLLGAILAVTLIGLFVTSRLSLFRARPGSGMFVLTVPIGDYLNNSEELLTLVADALPSGRVDSIAESESESVISCSFETLERPKLVELRRQVAELAPSASASVFFDRLSSPPP